MDIQRGALSFERFHPYVIMGNIAFLPHRLDIRLGCKNIALLGKRAYPRRGIDDIPVHIAFFNDSKSVVNGHFHPDLLHRPLAPVFHRQRVLNLRGRMGSSRRLLKRDHQPVPQPLDNPAPMLFDDRVEKIIVALHHRAAFQVAVDLEKLRGSGNIRKHHRHFALELRANRLIDLGFLAQKILDRGLMFVDLVLQCHDGSSCESGSP